MPSSTCARHAACIGAATTGRFALFQALRNGSYVSVGSWANPVYRLLNVFLSDVTGVEERRAPVDIFFRTLADTHERHAAAIILSGGPNSVYGESVPTAVPDMELALLRTTIAPGGVLPPPGAAQASSTRSPGSGVRRYPHRMAASSWTVNQPSR